MKRIAMTMFISGLFTSSLFGWEFKNLEMPPKSFDFADYERNLIIRDGKGQIIGSSHERLETKEDGLHFQYSEDDSDPESKTEEVRFKANETFTVDQLVKGKSHSYGSSKTSFTYNSDGFLIQEAATNQHQTIERKTEIERGLDNRIKKRTVWGPTGNVLSEENFSYDDISGLVKVAKKEGSRSFPRDSYQSSSLIEAQTIFYGNESSLQRKCT